MQQIVNGFFTLSPHTPVSSGGCMRENSNSCLSERQNGEMTCHQQQQLCGCLLDTGTRGVKSLKTTSNLCTYFADKSSVSAFLLKRNWVTAGLDVLPRNKQLFNILRCGTAVVTLPLCNLHYCHSHLDFSFNWRFFNGRREEDIS